ncbi:MAG TPA: hypothetical protein PLO51_04655, partial [Candidatus Micrarchaeota archaeon]|nr:hypothetical protein [Candidatus Micrarchaeota archaeon]
DAAYFIASMCPLWIGWNLPMKSPVFTFIHRTCMIYPAQRHPAQQSISRFSFILMISSAHAP